LNVLLEEELLVNIDALAKDKLVLAAGDIIELSAPAKQEPNGNKRLVTLAEVYYLIVDYPFL